MVYKFSYYLFGELIISSNTPPSAPGGIFVTKRDANVIAMSLGSTLLFHFLVQ